MKAGDLIKLKETSWVDPQYWDKTCIIVDISTSRIDEVIPDIDDYTNATYAYIKTFAVMDSDGYLIDSMREEDIELLEES